MVLPSLGLPSSRETSIKHITIRELVCWSGKLKKLWEVGGGGAQGSLPNIKQGFLSSKPGYQPWFFSNLLI